MKVFILSPQLLCYWNRKKNSADRFSAENERRKLDLTKKREKDYKRSQDKKKAKEIDSYISKKGDQFKNIIKTSDEDRTQVAGPSGDVSGGSTYQSRTQRG